MACVRFASTTGPGPSGFRPEHLAAMLTCNRRRAVNRLLQAIAEAQNLAAAGALPADGWSWIMDSRLILIAKKSGTVPRPIRVGEILKHLIAKHLLHRFESKVLQSMIEACQFGVSFPGRAESLVHARGTIEGIIRAKHDLGVRAVIDVDFHNAFPSDEPLGSRVPELQRWS